MNKISSQTSIYAPPENLESTFGCTKTCQENMLKLSLCRVNFITISSILSLSTISPFRTRITLPSSMPPPFTHTRFLSASPWRHMSCFSRAHLLPPPPPKVPERIHEKIQAVKDRWLPAAKGNLKRMRSGFRKRMTKKSHNRKSGRRIVYATRNQLRKLKKVMNMA